MEENINQVSGVEQKTATPQPEVKAQPIDKSAENTLSTIANIIVICGIIATLICLFTVVFVENPDYMGLDFQSKHIFNPSGFASTITMVFSILVSWSLLKVIANISITLKEINKKMK